MREEEESGEGWRIDVGGIGVPPCVERGGGGEAAEERIKVCVVVVVVVVGGKKRINGKITFDRGRLAVVGGGAVGVWVGVWVGGMGGGGETGCQAVEPVAGGGGGGAGGGERWTWLCLCFGGGHTRGHMWPHRRPSTCAEYTTCPSGFTAKMSFTHILLTYRYHDTYTCLPSMLPPHPCRSQCCRLPPLHCANRPSIQVMILAPGTSYSIFCSLSVVLTRPAQSTYTTRYPGTLSTAVLTPASW